MRSNALPHNIAIKFKAATGNLFAVSLIAATLNTSAGAQSAGTYKVTNLVSDGSVAAAVTDPNFINPWAISASGTWWISAQGSGYNYVVSSATSAISFKVIVPAANGTSNGIPAGSVTTGGTTGMILPNGTKASFLFSTLDGTISGWNSKLGTANALSQIAINNSAAGASYPGLAIINTSTASYMLAPNFGIGNAIEVYDGTFTKTKLAGTFTDPGLPANYAPFSVHVLGTQVFVAYALRTATAPYHTVNAPGNGIVSVFDINGNFVARSVTGGNLNAPWGVAIAPASFGIFSNALLIGNFGDGLIDAYDPKTYAYLGQLTDGTGKPLVYASLWELLPGGTTVGNTTAVSGGDTSTVYFTAGLTGEVHGLLGAISNSPTATGTPTYGFSAAAPSLTVAAGSSAQTTLSIAPTNNFSGSVNLSCNGLPVGTTCNFATNPITVSSTVSTLVPITIQTTKASATLHEGPLHAMTATNITSAFVLPFASLLHFRRRRQLGNGTNLLRLLGMLVFLATSVGFVSGCSSGYTAPPVPGTPTGQSNITVVATSGAITQQTTITLTVQ